MITDAAICKGELLAEAIERTNDALEALRTWDRYLRIWLTYPNQVSDDFFMAQLQDLSGEIGTEWPDSLKLDELRAALTGVDARYSNP